MPFHPKHDLKRGIHRLLSAPQDVPVRDPVPLRTPSVKLGSASPKHRALFAEYKGSLGDAIATALEWWDGMIASAVDRGADPAAAEKEVNSRTFAGPAAHGEVVWVVRTFWLRCVAANREIEADWRVPPQVMLLGWLIDERRNEWVTVLTGMPYWPIGLSPEGDWV